MLATGSVIFALKLMMETTIQMRLRVILKYIESQSHRMYSVGRDLSG